MRDGTNVVMMLMNNENDDDEYVDGTAATAQRALYASIGESRLTE